LPACRRHAGLPDEEWIAARVRAGARALARLEDLLSYPARDRMPCPVISGNTGMGKAMTIRKFLRDPPAAFDKAAGVTTMPVAAMQMPAQPIERDIHGEWLVSFEIACWYDLCADDLSQRLGVEPHERPIGFSGRDFALTPAAASAWGSACRRSEERVRDMALSTRRRPKGVYVCMGGGQGGWAVAEIRLSRLPGRRRRSRPGPSHSPDLGVGRELLM